MTYEPTQLVAGRRIGLGDASACALDPTTEWDANCTIQGIKGQCVPKGTVGKNPACSYSSGGVLSQIGGFFSNVLTGTLSNIGSKLAGANQAPQQPVVVSTTPSWVMPVVIGGGALAAVMILKKRKNPAPRRRRRR